MKQRFIILAMLLSVFSLASAQENKKGKKEQTEYAQPKNNETTGILSYIQNAMQFNVTVPQEKVYLHFDNTGYFEGETIWFKAYVMRADNQAISQMSKVLYVELLNPSGDVIQSQKLPIDENGQALGNIQLEKLFFSGFYEVRAYTRYMTNWGVNACFSRVFPVYQAPKEEGNFKNPTIVRSVLYRHRDPNLRDSQDSLYYKAVSDGIHTNLLNKTITAKFYPEGGDLILGKKCHVAVLTVDDNGKYYQGTGWVMNERGDILAKVETDSLGRGAFDVIPDGSRLTMQIRNLKDKPQHFDLPTPKAEGCALHIDMMQNDIVARLQSTDGICGNLLAYILMHNGTIVHADTMAATPLTEIELDRAKLPEGVNQLTVIDHKGQIMAERLFFIRPAFEAEDSIRITTPIQKPTPCGKVSLELHSRPNAFLSFAALDAATMNNRKQGNIKTWTLLSSEIKGYIHDIDYYFEADDSAHRHAADLLMLTQGWKRYDWNIMSGREALENIQPVEDKLYIYGKLREYRKRNKRGGVQLNVYLYNQAGQSLTGETTTDADGNYAFSMPNVNGEWKMQMFTRLRDKRKTYHVGISRQFSPTPRYINPEEASILSPNLPNLFVRPPFQELEDEDEYVPLNKKERVLKNVTVKAKRRYFTNDDFMYKNENWGAHFATIYYDMDRELDNIRDRGEDVPDLFTFLCKRNPLFNDPECLHIPKSFFPPRGTEADIRKLLSYHNYWPWDGTMSYAHRGIRWIVDNNETHNQGADSDDGHFTGDIDFPINLAEIKSIYIVPHTPWENSHLNKESRVRIYIYRHHVFSTESQKGLRHTYFQGFNVPETFRTEDYSVVPPMEDFRRTIYWNPSIKTDKDGCAKVEFYNNSSCKEMYISTEGMTEEGKLLMNE